MALPQVKLGSVSVCKFIIGGNPFSGFSHQSTNLDADMVKYFTTARIKESLRAAEALGVNGHISRSDHHVIRYLREYWDEGGKVQWLAQTCPELGTIARGVDNAIRGKAAGCHIHGGVMDNLYANKQLDEIPAAIQKIKDAGLAAGMAGHTPEVFRWADEHVDVDYYMCSYHNPIPRANNPEHVHGYNEYFGDDDRDAMVKTIKNLRKPVIHYKVLAAGRKTPLEAFAFVAQHLRPQDAVCVGVFPKDHSDMIREDLQILEQCLRKAGKL